MEVVEITKNEKNSFNEFVEKNGTFLQSFDWGEFKNNFEWKPYRFAVINKGIWVLSASVLQKKLPFNKSFLYVPEGPVLNKEHWGSPSKIKEYVSALLNKIESYSEKENAIFLRIEPSFENVQPKHRLWVDLSLNEEEILRQMKHKGRYNIRIAKDDGVTILETRDDDKLDAFYKLLLETTKRDKFSSRPKEYFQFLLDLLWEKNIGGLFLAFIKNIPLAGAIISFWGKHALYLYGASSNQHREVMASYLLHWEIIKKAKQRGCTFYDFGAIAPNDNPNHIWAGLRQFKSKFGGDEIHLPGCFDFVYQKTNYNLFKTIEKVRRKI